ncbi:ParB N-terminal domain-containing protein [uncultured Umboniibacter sp.]|uniref:ParB N-terminal domain-containing protein n=1 Tax=uncultured Umboniibacter sp. TaxID=1798917 RepID=UPI00260D5178|nr:ParB N-terminal domain-containing protein [uncultured Umboniibacter sp.]
MVKEREIKRSSGLLDLDILKAKPTETKKNETNSEAGESITAKANARAKAKMSGLVSDTKEFAKPTFASVDLASISEPTKPYKCAVKDISPDDEDIVVPVINARAQEGLREAPGTAALLEELKRDGQTDPIILSKRDDGKLELISGSRRRMAISIWNEELKGDGVSEKKTVRALVTNRPMSQKDALHHANRDERSVKKLTILQKALATYRYKSTYGMTISDACEFMGDFTRQTYSRYEKLIELLEQKSVEVNGSTISLQAFLWPKLDESLSGRGAEDIAPVLESAMLENDSTRLKAFMEVVENAPPASLKAGPLIKVLSAASAEKASARSLRKPFDGVAGVKLTKNANPGKEKDWTIKLQDSSTVSDVADKIEALAAAIRRGDTHFG